MAISDSVCREICGGGRISSASRNEPFSGCSLVALQPSLTGFFRARRWMLLDHAVAIIMSIGLVFESPAHDRRYPHPLPIESGDPHAAEQLLPLVYDELRRLATEKMAQEKPGQTLQATAPGSRGVHSASGHEKAQHWDSRGHFFAAAAEAMRRILVEQSRRKCLPEEEGYSIMPGCRDHRVRPSIDLTAVDEALVRFEQLDKLNGRAGPTSYSCRADQRASRRSPRHLSFNCKDRIGLTPNAGCGRKWRSTDRLG